MLKVKQQKHHFTPAALGFERRNEMRELGVMAAETRAYNYYAHIIAAVLAIVDHLAGRTALSPSS